MLEAAIGISVAWLWSKLADVAEAKDKEIAIKEALEKSISQSYRNFQNKYGDSSESFFNNEFLEKNVCPELLKYLTRNQQPDLESVAKALPVNAIFVSNSGFRNEVKDFFDMVVESMKSHAVLQDFINNRQIEETTQRTKEIEEGQRTTNKQLEEGFSDIVFEQQQTSLKVDEVSTQNSQIGSDIKQIKNLIADNLPASKGNEVNKILVRQLDRARVLIGVGSVNDAHDLLMSLEDDVSESDDYTRFRWHTNIGACKLAHDKKKEAAEQYFTAYNFAKNEEKAVANRVRAYLLIDDFKTGLIESETALKNFSTSGIVWALHINAKQLLNEKFDESLIPGDLLEDSTILLILSDMRLRENRFEESFSLAKKSFEVDETSSDAKRAMLASAISWITTDTVKSFYRHFSTAQNEALQYAIDSFGEIIPFLKTIQSKHIFTEVAHNLAVASELLNDQDTKRKVSTYSFATYPDENVFLWYKVKELRETNNNTAIHELTDGILDSLDKPLLFTLAEISANKGDKEWNEKVLEHLSAKDLDNKEQDELFGLNVCTLWRSGNKSDAIELARENLARINTYPSLLSFYIRMLDEYGEFDERDNLLQTCANIKEGASSHDVLQIADLLFNFERFYEAAGLYCRIIESPSDDSLTKRYLDCLVKSDQRAKAGEVLEQLNEGVRSQSSFRRIEANLARASGDLDTLETILKDELEKYPLDSGLATGYIATLYRKGKLDDLHDYLSGNHVYKPVLETNEIEIAKYAMELGLEYQAIFRMYSLFRNDTNSSFIAGYYLLLIFQAKQENIFEPLVAVTSGCAVYLESNGSNKIIVIEPNNLSSNGWPECASEDSEIAKQLIGYSVGDHIDVDISMGVHEATIIKIENMFVFASNRAHKVVANSASSAGPVWSVNVTNRDGNFDFSPILDSLKSKNQHVEHVFGVYDEKRLPLQILADALGSDLVTLWLEWPSKKFDLFVTSGINEELEKLQDIIIKADKSYVVDFPCLIELNRLGMLSKSLVILGKPLVALSVKEQLLGLIQIHNKMVPSGVASEVDGQLAYQDISAKQIEARGAFLNKILVFIDTHCDVVPVIGPNNLTEQQTALGGLIGYSSQDVIYLTLERDAVLVSEDGAFRLLAKSMGVAASTWIQPLLMILRDDKAIGEDEYSRCVINKLNVRHSFTSVEANDLLWAAKSCTHTVSPDVESAIETFRNPALDLASGVVVGSQFLKGAVECVSPSALYDYYKLIIDSLSYKRDQYVNDIHESLRSHIVSALPQIKHKKSKLISRKFGHLLYAPPPRSSQIRINPLTDAIRLALRQWR